MIYTSEVLHTEQQALDAIEKLKKIGGRSDLSVGGLPYPCVLSMSDTRFDRKINFTNRASFLSMQELRDHLRSYYKDDFKSPMALEDVLKL